MAMDERERELVLQREMPFPRELVWKAMTDPDHVNNWWGPDGFRNEGVIMGFRVGGAWTFDMRRHMTVRYSPSASYIPAPNPATRW